jgi:PAS domain S-box-containing protein
MAWPERAVETRRPADRERPRRLTIAPLAMWVFIALGAVAIAGSLAATWRTASPLPVLALIALGIGAEFIQVQIYEADQQRLSLSFTIAVVLAAVVVEPVAAPLVSLAAAVVHVVGRRQHPLGKALFNLGNPALAAAVAAATAVWLRPLALPFDLGAIAAATAATLAFLAANFLPIALMISLHSGRSFLSVMRGSAWCSPASVLLGVTGAYLGGAYPTLGPIGLLLFIGPVLLLRFMLVAYARQSQRTIEATTAAKSAVEAAEARWRSVFEGAADGILVADDSGRWQDANPAARAILGRSLEEIRRLDAAEAGLLPTLGAAATAGGEPAPPPHGGAGEARRPDGTVVPIEWRLTAVDLPSGALTICLLRDISDQRAAERMRHEFTAMVSHELNTPVTTIKGLAQRMRRGQRFDEENVSTIIRQAEHLTRLVSDLLDVSQLEAGGHLHLHRRSLDMVALARAIRAQASASTSRHTVRCEAAEEALLADADRDRVMQVLQNLLSNAIKYSPDGGEIVVRVARRGDAAEVTVSDQGVGIPPDERAHLFERYYRTEAAVARQIKGLGLGLYICHRIVEAHGGAMWVESTVGQGSVFGFTLPLAAAAGADSR